MRRRSLAQVRTQPQAQGDKLHHAGTQVPEESSQVLPSCVYCRDKVTWSPSWRIPGSWTRFFIPFVKTGRCAETRRGAPVSPSNIDFVSLSTCGHSARIPVLAVENVHSLLVPSRVSLAVASALSLLGLSASVQFLVLHSLCGRRIFLSSRAARLHLFRNIIYSFVLALKSVVVSVIHLSHLVLL